MKRILRPLSRVPTSVVFSAATLNLLDDLLFWEQRGPLVLEGFRSLLPDVVGLQEVSLDPPNAEWLAHRLPGYSAYLCPRTRDRQSDSLAVLTHLPVESHDVLYLGVQGRQAQKVVVNHHGRRWTFVNAHLVWHPFDDKVRRQQAARILEWIADADRVVLCGDFNALPSAKSVALLKTRLRSAHEAAHGREPESTYPTALQRGPGLRHWGRHAVLRANGIVRRRNVRWGGTVDYIMVDPAVEVLSCEVVFDKPSPRHPKLFASDHLGLFARLEAAA
jgi:endonuclease/exonuclease/phosphatase family metal-dependent hydrolase